MNECDSTHYYLYIVMGKRIETEAIRRNVVIRDNILLTDYISLSQVPHVFLHILPKSVTAGS